MKRVIIIHCWEGYPEYCWYPYAKKALEQLGFQVEVPLFPDTEKPQLNKWLSHLQSVIGESDEELFLVGHSVGCITILRYLESLSKGKKIGGVVFVAGYIGDLGYDELKNFFITPVNFQKVKSHCDKFIAIHSDNDPYVDIKFADFFKKELGAEVIIKNNMGHFSGSIESEQACLKLPEVVESVKKLAKFI